MDKRKILLIGWDAADWKIINPLMDTGQMPSLERLVNDGTICNLATLEPPFSPMLWTSIATGMYPDKHGVISFTEPLPDGSGIRPVSTFSRKVKAIWNILMQNGYKVNVVNWWPSHPAEPVNGVMVSNLYGKITGPPTKWPMLKNSVYPEALTALLTWLRVHPAELTAAHLLPFVPDAAKIDQEKDNQLNVLANNIAESATIQAAVTWIMENTEWDFMAVYFDAIDHVCHGFMNYHPPQLKGIPDDQFHLYKDVVQGIYRYHDMLLGRLLEIAGNETTVILVSDHGFHSDHLRPVQIGDEPAAPTAQHRTHGIVCLKGPGIKKDERIYSATLLDITPTILSLCNLPIGKDMDGVPLIQSFEHNLPVSHIPSWELVEGRCGMHPEEAREDTFLANEALEQLVKLGYVEAPDQDAKVAVGKAIDEAKYNLARSYIGSNRYNQAIELLSNLYDKKKEPRFATRLITSYIETGNLKKAKAIITAFREEGKAEIDKLDRKIWDLSNKMESNHESSETEKEKIKKELDKSRNRLMTFKYSMVRVDMYEAELASKWGKYSKALELYRNVEKKSIFPDLYLKMGNTFLKLKYWKDATHAFSKVIAIDSHNAAAHHGLGISHVEQKEYDKGISHLLESLSLNHQNPGAHYLLGKTLFKLEEYEQAVVSLEMCLLMSPDMGIARNLIIDIYDKYLQNSEKADMHKLFFQQGPETKPDKEGLVNKERTQYLPAGVQRLESERYTDNTIFVVSGLPRSGTSLMMQILEKAGIPVFKDDKRKADENNPLGYYEHRWVKRLASDNSWIEQASGSAVKVISHLIFYLPARFNYKIIFMLRNLKEVVISQNKMLSGKGKADEKSYPYSIELAYAKNLKKARKWISNHHNVDVLYVDHTQLMKKPLSVVNEILEFTGINGNSKEIASVVDNSLYRVKIDEKTGKLA